jgi:hypothetical protein
MVQVVTSSVTRQGYDGGVMSDGLPFYHPENKPQVRKPKPGIVIWILRKGPQKLRCELRDDSGNDAGWDLQLFDVDGLLSASRRPTESNALDAAKPLRQLHLRDG